MKKYLRPDVESYVLNAAEEVITASREGFDLPEDEMESQSTP